MIIVDLDDFHEHNTSWELLLQIKKQIPQFKVNLFTIPGKCSLEFVINMREHEDWVDLIPHGLFHVTSRECERWNYTASVGYLKWVNRFNMTKGFKAPGWQISSGMYTALVEYKYWVADQSYNDMRRPKDLTVYKLDSPDKIHGHIGHLGGHNPNELSIILPEILKHREETFGFIKDAI